MHLFSRTTTTSDTNAAMKYVHCWITMHLSHQPLWDTGHGGARRGDDIERPPVLHVQLLIEYNATPPTNGLSNGIRMHAQRVHWHGISRLCSYSGTKLSTVLLITELTTCKQRSGSSCSTIDSARARKAFKRSVVVSRDVRCGRNVL